MAQLTLTERRIIADMIIENIRNNFIATRNSIFGSKKYMTFIRNEIKNLNDVDRVIEDIKTLKEADEHVKNAIKDIQVRYGLTHDEINDGRTGYNTTLTKSMIDEKLKKIIATKLANDECGVMPIPVLHTDRVAVRLMQYGNADVDGMIKIVQQELSEELDLPIG